jgi:U3 small nucleolar ribonucleoprotein protein LCP5
MATETNLIDTLSSFTAAANLATGALPDIESLLMPAHGITLLHMKNEIFLAYLQALALRNLNVIRSLRDGRDAQDVQKLSNELTAKLIEHRAYLERGVRPLEQKMKYQTDRVVKVADDEDRAAEQKQKRSNAVNGQTNGGAEDDNSSNEDEDESSEDEAGQKTAHHTNFTGIASPTAPSSKPLRGSKSTEDGVYRPPRIAATAMPTTESRERKEQRPGRSATVDEYVNTEMSSAPMAQPSIGSTIAQGGRKTKDARQLAKEQERRDYEETHLMRLPKESKKELAKQRARDRRSGFGGEEWSELGNAVDRIGELTKKKSRDGALDKSRKRRAVEDGPRNDGIGNAFDVKKRRVMKKFNR